jgi:hypothetical protein
VEAGSEKPKFPDYGEPAIVTAVLPSAISTLEYELFAYETLV